MKKYALIIFVLLYGCLLYPNGGNIEKFNFDFEDIDNGIPRGWSNNKHYANEYIFSLDSLNAISGKYSVSLENNSEDANPGIWSLIIPYSYKGKTITLSGYIKTENVQHGYAGLWIKIDPNIAYADMAIQGVKGTNEWKQYSIAVALKPDITEEIVIGGVLKGKGKAWFDDFSLSIDETDIHDLNPLPTLPAKADREFEKGSGITDIPLSNCNIEKIKTMGLLWGFIKYHHPAVAEGKHNFDFELFRILPKILETDSKKEQDDIVVKWIKGLGEIGEVGEIRTSNDEVHIVPDYTWVDNNNFSSALIDLLFNIRNVERKDKGYYISRNNIGNPIFDHEDKYENMKYPDTGYRLLALFRYWNIIQYFFPYKHLIDGNWEKVLEEFIPKFIDPKNETEYVLAVSELITRIHDTHAQLYTPSSVLTNILGNRYAVPKISFIKETPVVTGFMNDSLSQLTGLKLGDVILSIDNKPIKEIVSKRLPYISSSNYPTKLRYMALELMRSNNEYIDVEYLRDGDCVKTRVGTYPSDCVKELFSFISDKPDTCFIKIVPDISYLYSGKFKNSYLFKLWEDIKSSKGLIIDLRCYPEEFMVYSFGALLVPQPTLFCKAIIADIKNPGRFIFTYPGTIGNVNPFYYKGKVVILVNEETQSQAEFTAMAFRMAPNAVVIGSTTSGADGDVSIIRLPGNLQTLISGIGILNPDGSETQRVGIIPDMEICPTIEGIKSGRDELLEKAIEIINID